MDNEKLSNEAENPALNKAAVSSSASKDNEHLWRQFCKLGEMMGDGLHYEPDGKWIASTSWDKTVMCWSVQTGSDVLECANRSVWRFTGPSDDVQAEIPFINIIGAGGSAIAPSGSKYFRMGLTAAAEQGSSACFVGGQTFVVEIRSLALRAVVARRIDISD
jgi:hypothetical protein